MMAKLPSRFHPGIVLATWFGAGCAPKASGTFGSLAALPMAYMIQVYAGNGALMATSVIVFLIGLWASKVYLARHPGDADPKPIVIDEVAGQCLLLSVLFPTWQSYLVGFVLFRLFDIFKPWPVSWADQEVGGAMGVMLDDMLAGFYPIVLLLILYSAAALFHLDGLLTPVMLFLGGDNAH